MNYLTEIPSAFLWGRKSGVYNQYPLFKRDETLFAKVGSGYVRLHASGATTVPSFTWLEIDPGPDYRLESNDLAPPKLVSRKKRLKEVA